MHAVGTKGMQVLINSTLRDFVGSIGLDGKFGPNFRVADQTGVLRVALCFATSRPDTLENTWKDEVFRVFSQSFFSRESVSVLSLVGQCEISESYRLSQRLRAQQISARAVGREGVGRFHQTWGVVCFSNSSGRRLYHSSPHSSDRRKHYSRERDLVAWHGPAVQPLGVSAHGNGNLWNSAEEYGPFCVVED